MVNTEVNYAWMEKTADEQEVLQIIEFKRWYFTTGYPIVKLTYGLDLPYRFREMAKVEDLVKLYSLLGRMLGETEHGQA